LRKPWLPWLPEENGWSNETAAMLALKHHVQKNFKASVQRCREQPSCQKPPSLVWTLDSIVIEDGEDRQMPFPKGVWSFEEGDQYTMVIIHKAIDHMAMAHPGVTGVEAAQHLAITGHYIPKAGTLADYFYILPSTHAEWAWYNGVDWFVALANYGGSGASDAQAGSSLWLGAVLGGVLVLACIFTLIIAIVLRKILALMLDCWSMQLDDYENHFREGKSRHEKYLEVGSQARFGKDADDSVAETSKIMAEQIGNIACV